VRNLELLKLRFGESSLHNCEIMLKDMADSKRTNGLVNTNLQKAEPTNIANDFKLDMIIVSHLFWPTFRDENVILPDQVKSQFDKYCKQYEHLKRPRQLTRKPHLGTVQLDLEFDDKVLSFTVSPAHAAIICLFQDDNEPVSLETIAAKVGMTREGARKKLAFWVNHQILAKVQKDHYQLVSSPLLPPPTTPALSDDHTVRKDKTANQPHQAPTGVGMMMEEEEEAGGGGQLASAADLQEEKMRVCEQFILGMLTNLDRLPLDRIHMMLSNFVENYQGDLHLLRAFMLKLIKEDKVELVGNEYTKKQ